MANYYTRLRNIGCQELTINTVKEKLSAMGPGPNQVKKPRKAEVNFCPSYLADETKESLVEEREAIVLEIKKKNNKQLIKRKMEKKIVYRKQEIIKDMPFIAEVKTRWPALFSETEVIVSNLNVLSQVLLCVSRKNLY